MKIYNAPWVLSSGNAWRLLKRSECRKLPERTGTAFPVVNVFKNAVDGIANRFPAKNALDCRIFHVQSRKISGCDTPGPLQKRFRCLDPDNNFRLSRQRSHCSCFTKRQLRYAFSFGLQWKTVFHCWSHFCFVSASSNNYTQRNPRTVSKLASWKAAEQPYVIFRTGYYAVT